MIVGLLDTFTVILGPKTQPVNHLLALTFLWILNPQRLGARPEKK